MTYEQAVDYLTAAYRAEVQFRGHEFRDNGKTAANIQAIARPLTQEKGCHGLLLCGWPGVGKTTMLYAFQNMLNRLSSQRCFEDGEPDGITILNAREIANAARDNKEFRRICTRPMLAIEDMGTEPIEVMDYGNRINPVVELIYYRYDMQLFTFITTNLATKEIRPRYGDRVADRFSEMMAVVSFREDKADTYRQQY